MKFLFLIVLLLPTVAFADCPLNTAYAGPYEWTNSSPTWNESISCNGLVAVDLPAGKVQLTGGAGIGEQTCGTGLSVSDVYQLVGPVSAAPLAFLVKIHVSGELPAHFVQDPYLGHMCYGSSVTSDISSGSSVDHFSEDTYAECADRAFATDRSLALAKLPGESFTIRFSLAASGYLPGTIRQAVTFEGLPAGYSVHSCQGYAVNQPVPVASTSWGSLKASYR